MSDPVGQEVVWMQRALSRALASDSEVLLEITVPFTATDEHFRIGWSLKAARTSRWLAISTGLATWSVHDLRTSAQHIESILACSLEVVRPDLAVDERR